MNKKMSIGVCISLIAIACTITFVITWTLSLDMYNDIIPGAVRRDEVSAKLREIDSFVRNNCLLELNDERIDYGIFSGYISGIEEKNTIYMTLDEHTRFNDRESGKLITCGIIAEKEGTDYIKVTEVYRGSDAEASGVVKGDIITGIDGMSVRDIGAEAALLLIPGEENTRVELVIQKDGEPSKRSLIRQSIDIVSVDAEITENNIGIARISTFNDLTAEQFEEALEMFAEAQTNAMLFDLRDNESGFYSSVSEMCNFLTGEGVIAYSEHKGGARRELIVTDNDLYLPEEMRDIPIVILTNKTTSGAAELFAAVLTNNAGALLVGENTAGNLYIQQTHPLKDGSAIRVTVARVVLTDGFDYSEGGLSPDFAIEYGDDDQQMQKAIEIIETNINNTH